MPLIVVVAENYEAFDKWCKKNNVDSRNRKQVIPLTVRTDTYRLLGRDLSDAKFVKVGTIGPRTIKYFTQRIKEAKVGRSNSNEASGTP